MADVLDKRPSEWTPEDMAEVIKRLEAGDLQIAPAYKPPNYAPGVMSGSLSIRPPSFNPCGEVMLASGSLGGRKI